MLLEMMVRRLLLDMMIVNLLLLLLMVRQLVVVTLLQCCITAVLAGLHSQRGGGQLHAQLVHPLHDTVPAVHCSAAILSQTVLKLSAKLLPVGAEVEEVVALLHSDSLLLRQSWKH